MFMFVCLFLFCTEVPMDDIKSVVHRFKSFAQDATQAGRALAQGCSWGVQRAGLW